MNEELIKALNRVARAMERSNNEKVQRRLARAKTEAMLEMLDDKAMVARVTDALKGIVPQEVVYPGPTIAQTIGQTFGRTIAPPMGGTPGGTL
jgi:DNA polymerase/3'-5' exonuclease PolX